MRDDIELDDLAISFQGLRADVHARPVAVPSFEEFGDRGLRRIDAFAGRMLRDQAREFKLSSTLRAFDVDVSDTALAREWIDPNIEFQFPAIFSAPADMTPHRQIPFPVLVLICGRSCSGW